MALHSYRIILQSKTDILDSAEIVRNIFTKKRNFSTIFCQKLFFSLLSNVTDILMKGLSPFVSYLFVVLP